jgi:hypothetical protein
MGWSDNSLVYFQNRAANNSRLALALLVIAGLILIHRYHFHLCQMSSLK